MISRRHVIITVGLLGAAAVIGPASAAQLAVSSDEIQVEFPDRCDPGPLATTYSGTPSGQNYSEVEIENVPAACDGLQVSLIVYDVGFNQIGTGTGTAATGSTVISTDNYKGSDAVGVALLIDTWGIPTSWTGPGTPPPGAAVTCIPYNNGGSPQLNRTCTVTSVTHDTPYNGGAAGTISGVTINVSATSTSWRIVIDFTHPDFPFEPEWIGQSFQTAAIDGACTSPVSTLTLQPANGQTWGGYFNYSSIQAPAWWSGTTICP